MRLFRRLGILLCVMLAPCCLSGKWRWVLTSARTARLRAAQQAIRWQPRSASRSTTSAATPYGCIWFTAGSGSAQAHVSTTTTLDAVRSSWSGRPPVTVGDHPAYYSGDAHQLWVDLGGSLLYVEFVGANVKDEQAESVPAWLTLGWWTGWRDPGPDAERDGHAGHGPRGDVPADHRRQAPWHAAGHRGRGRPPLRRRRRPPWPRFSVPSPPRARHWPMPRRRSASPTMGLFFWPSRSTVAMPLRWPLCWRRSSAAQGRRRHGKTVAGKHTWTTLPSEDKPPVRVYSSGDIIWAVQAVDPGLSEVFASLP